MEGEKESWVEARNTLRYLYAVSHEREANNAGGALALTLLGRKKESKIHPELTFPLTHHHAATMPP
jgi:hypothetical protein